MRGLAMPTWGRPPDENWDHGSKWSIDWQAGSTRLGAGDGWMGTLDTGSANWSASDNNVRYDVDSRETAAWTVPQLMPVGVYEPQVFGCAGGRTQNDAGRTTWLVEAIPGAIPPNPGDRGRVSSIQDLLYGDDKFVYSNEPLALEKKPPTPNVSGPGDPSGGWGAVQCAMAQVGDDRTTRELHMINVAKGHLVHAVASRWGTATRDDGATFNRFGAISGWRDVSQELGVNFGPITSAAVVARSSALSVFFVAASGGRYRLWHTVRFPDGSWRPAKDVFALSGDAANGTVNEIDGVAAANCPANGAGTSDASSTETTVAIWDGPIPNQVNVIRVVPTPQQWQTGVTGVYAPWQRCPDRGARSKGWEVRPSKRRRHRPSVQRRPHAGALGCVPRPRCL